MVPDPLSEKYYGISPYAYCAGNPVSFVDSDGKEKVFAMMRRPNGKDSRYKQIDNGMKLLKEDLKKYAQEQPLINEAQNAPDYDNIVTVYAHGRDNGTKALLFRKDNKPYLSSSNNLKNYLILESSLVQTSVINGKNSVIVLNICKSGIDEQSLGSNLSKEMQGSLIIAPDSNVNGTGASDNLNGKWNMFLNGKIVDSFDASSDNYHKKMQDINQNIDFYLRRYVE